MSKKITYLIDIQKDYFNLLNSKRDIIFFDNLSLIEISKIVEEVDIFWRKNRDKFLFDLDYFSDKETLFLAGSMYLDFEDNKHYYFKTFGQEHIVNEPILKFKDLLNNNMQDAFDIISIFKRSFNNTLKLLESYNSYFYILPLDYIISVYHEELIKSRNKIFYQLVSSIFEEVEISSPNSFSNKFNSIEEIENILIEKNIDLFEFEKEDKNLSLKEKLDKYENRIPISFDNYMMKFICLLYNYWNQIIHIFITFLELGFIPYFSFKEAFINFPTLFLSLYLEDDANEILNKIILFYTFNLSIDVNDFIGLNFEEYVNLVKNEDFQEKLIDNADELFSKGLNLAIKHISMEFNDLIEKI